jgi:hypothetical protein
MGSERVFFTGILLNSKTFLITFETAKKRRFMRFFQWFLILLSFNGHFLLAQSKKELKLHKKAEKKLASWQDPFSQWKHLGAITIDTISINPEGKQLTVEFSTPLSYLPVREDIRANTIRLVRGQLGRKFRDYEIRIVAGGKSLESLIPNYYRRTIAVDSGRFAANESSRIPLVRRAGRQIPERGLHNRNIALWNSHGWYYESKLDRWEWQRARLYGTVEDLFPTTFVLPYLVPMLENAGANVFLPRERDTQVNEVIVDNDRSSDGSELIFPGLEPEEVPESGFLMKDTLFGNENPFMLGSYLRFTSTVEDDSHIDYIPGFTSDGDYAVYVSYQQDDNNISSARYIVSHTGGKTEFLVNQKIGGGTWVYLGTFHFPRGKNIEYGSVRITSQSDEEGWISTDAIRFGGGMGHVARRPADKLLSNEWSLSGGQKGPAGSAQSTNPDAYQWKTSQKPRYQEGARYYLQFAGAPDSLVYSLNEGMNDYNDDYQSRGEWINYLMGTPNGPNINRTADGLHIPIDLSLAFHTDAGVTPKDSTIGTLAIYSSVRDDGKFPNGQSKMVNRDLADIVQSEIVDDIRSQLNAEWSRRAMWDKQYSEAWRPNVPSMLLELLSHQNLTDMSYGHDPRFKFVVSRAIYKGIVRFLAYQNHSDYVIQPLPVDHFAISIMGNKKIKLTWDAVLDSLEPSAVVARYKVYQRVGDRGFDNGKIINGNSLELEIPDYGEIYSYKVTAINEGGESFPSEVLSVGLVDNKKMPVLVVNAFDRVAAPAIQEQGDFAGLAQWDDEGVPDKFDIGHTGSQYDFDRTSSWLDDDSPGWGASYGDMEGKPIPGNSFDNTVAHGRAIMGAGYSFISMSDEAFTNSTFDLSAFETVDLIFGEEKSTVTQGGTMFQVFDREMQRKISAFTSKGGNVFASGAYLGSDPILTNDTIAADFANEVLHFKWRTNHAAKDGVVYSTDYAGVFFDGDWVFNTNYHPVIYKVEAPDALEPVGENAIAAFRYGENNTSAGTIFNGSYKTVILGFPFETIVEPEERADLMRQILTFFEKSR